MSKQPRIPGTTKLRRGPSEYGRLFDLAEDMMTSPPEVWLEMSGLGLDEMSRFTEAMATVMARHIVGGNLTQDELIGALQHYTGAMMLVGFEASRQGLGGRLQ